ncbi:hypothetical protein [Nocardioides sp. T2.26MG-1]|uniref:hypothetical protein n=1 Tax=Nocardioides sp. T2.26MG-1 TaxID=3041166 RepID=UPI002477459B|nr:hypothetical protein [Nocardioides sp. T2.26MG-1]CAI9411081.1 hypothetical protein HIDPHFAB_01465 [Nocardioides sp. T2.26MG-1]
MTPRVPGIEPSDWARSQLVLRALMLLGPVAALLASGPTGHAAPWWLVGVVAALAGVWAWYTDVPFGAAPLLVVIGWWAAALGSTTSAWLLVAAAALLVAHVAAVLASYGPPAMPVDRAVTRLWVRRGALVLLTAPVAWGAARALRDQPEQPGIWVLGVAVACVATLIATAALRTDQEER